MATNFHQLQLAAIVPGTLNTGIRSTFVAITSRLCGCPWSRLLADVLAATTRESAHATRSGVAVNADDPFNPFAAVLYTVYCILYTNTACIRCRRRFFTRPRYPYLLTSFLLVYRNLKTTSFDQTFIEIKNWSNIRNIGRDGDDSLRYILKSRNCMLWILIKARLAMLKIVDRNRGNIYM